ncbi:hypothetical protein [Aquimarina intermedia]|uniref:PH (Pleckstrin Homology) domain-containing protein n=1 Tax=Aquimarina intermedia TaxID=350814 RepID=A0A5S5BXQ2_9FLAO|nr:hypothetical protein [Aquimarina intermedia]TYP70413.1 hypothetical protein BD809_1125 [Aquimarina intermedia]
MKILYKSRLLRNNLVTGVFFTLLGMIGFALHTSNLFSSYLVVMGVIYIIVYAVMKSKGYVSIENGVFTKNTGFFKQINVKDIQKVMMFKDSYRIDSPKKTITLYKSSIHHNSELVLLDFFKQLQLAPNEHVLKKVG